MLEVITTICKQRKNAGTVIRVSTRKLYWIQKYVKQAVVDENRSNLQNQ